MRTKKRRTNSWPKILFLAFLILSVQLGTVGSVRALSIEDETAMGQKFMENIGRQFDFLDDDFANDYLNDLGQYLIRPLETKPFPFRFYLVRDQDLNAFAGPGGHIFVFSGLVVALDTIDELAAVVCHEIGHVSARHISERIEQAKKIGLASLAGVLAGILVGGQGGAAILSGTVAAGIQKQLAYSREDERQADQRGFQYMVQAGYDPAGMIATLEKLEKGQWYGTDGVPSYLLTHPVGPERISNMEVMLSGLGKREGGSAPKEFRQLYPFFKTTVAAKTGDPSEMEAQFSKALEKDPGSVLAHYGLGIVRQDRSDYDKAISHFQAALKGSPDSLPILRRLAESYQLKGQDKEALRILERAARLDSLDRSTLFLLAKSYQNMEEDAKAIPLYERLLLMPPVKDEVYYDLGLAYGRQNRLGQAHYNFAIFFKRTGAKGKAKFHFQKAEDLSKGDPVLQRKIREAMGELRP
ncbi:MAG: M48 family metalloprotease [Deltaproteobacteria bacterium]|nr:M48 family metalloprotease [Deltaproteobacteria bacterium]